MVVIKIIYIYVKHKHEDYQLRLITRGEGFCMVEDNIVGFKKGNILFVGQMYRIALRYLS